MNGPPVPIDLTVRNVIRMLPLAGTDIEIVADLDAIQSLVRADASIVEEAVMSMAVQARASIHGRGKIYIGTSQLFVDGQMGEFSFGVRPGPYVQVTVTDTGDGEPSGFETPAGMETLRSFGCGFLLHRVRGMGTTCRLLMPDAGGRQFQEADAAETAEMRGHGTILVVEDEALIREYVCEILCAAGYTVLRSGNCAEAREIASQPGTGIELLLTDLNLPDGPGHELAAAIQHLCPGMEVLIMSGHGMSDHDCQTGDEVALQKPFSPADLLGKTRQLLDARRHTAA